MSVYLFGCGCVRYANATVDAAGLIPFRLKRSLGNVVPTGDMLHSLVVRSVGGSILAPAGSSIMGAAGSVTVVWNVRCGAARLRVKTSGLGRALSAQTRWFGLSGCRVENLPPDRPAGQIVASQRVVDAPTAVPGMANGSGRVVYVPRSVVTTIVRQSECDGGAHDWRVILRGSALGHGGTRCNLRWIRPPRWSGRAGPCGKPRLPRRRKVLRWSIRPSRCSCRVECVAFALVGKTNGLVCCIGRRVFPISLGGVDGAVSGSPDGG